MAFNPFRERHVDRSGDDAAIARFLAEREVKRCPTVKLVEGTADVPAEDMAAIRARPEPEYTGPMRRQKGQVRPAKPPKPPVVDPIVSVPVAQAVRTAPLVSALPAIPAAPAPPRPRPVPPVPARAPLDPAPAQDRPKAPVLLPSSVVQKAEIPAPPPTPARPAARRAPPSSVSDEEFKAALAAVSIPHEMGCKPALPPCPGTLRPQPVPPVRPAAPLQRLARAEDVEALQGQVATLQDVLREAHEAFGKVVDQVTALRAELAEVRASVVATTAAPEPARKPARSGPITWWK